MTEALLALYFGENDAKEAEDMSLPMYAHGDLHRSNMVFRGGPAVYGKYPCLVLIDFGKAKSLTTAKSPADLFPYQQFGINSMLFEIASLMCCSRRPEFDILMDEVGGLDLQGGCYRNLVFQTWMVNLKAKAIRERDDSYVPLQPEVVKHFQKEFISNNALWRRTNARRLAEPKADNR